MTRRRSDSSVKWTLNELAAVKGERARIQQELARLQARDVELQSVEQSLHAVLTSLTEVPVSLEALPSVDAHRRYKERGQLRNFIRQTLRDAYPDVLDTCRIADLVAGYFGLEHPTPKQKKAFQDNSIRNALGRLAQTGEIERLSHAHQGGGRATLWRWSSGLPSLSELQKAVEAAHQEAS